ncbi:hypothetical protein T492DRAFT_972432 [Pavlovales sp. CCMP2436]|nr:hypothetical protein T492DRAFT_972432 [Pavlovales sp. CCMP2436]
MWLLCDCVSLNVLEGLKRSPIQLLYRFELDGPTLVRVPQLCASPTLFCGPQCAQDESHNSRQQDQHRDRARHGPDIRGAGASRRCDGIPPAIGPELPFRTPAFRRGLVANCVAVDQRGFERQGRRRSRRRRARRRAWLGRGLPHADLVRRCRDRNCR